MAINDCRPRGIHRPCGCSPAKTHAIVDVVTKIIGVGLAAVRALVSQAQMAKLATVTGSINKFIHFDKRLCCVGILNDIKRYQFSSSQWHVWSDDIAWGLQW